MKMLHNKKGFTLIEIVVILAVIAVLAAVISPMIIGYIKDAKIRRAEMDVKVIGTAIMAFNKDTRDWPIWSDGSAMTTPVEGLKSVGDVPSGTLPGSRDTIEDQLITNVAGYATEGRRRWRGPYLEKVTEDPWGNAYYVDVEGLQKDQLGGFMAVFAISAGPNEDIETAFGQTGPSITVVGDDITYRIK